MNRKIGIVVLIGLLFSGLIGFYIGRHTKQKSTLENTLATISSPSPLVTILPIPTASPPPPTATPIPTEQPIEQKVIKGIFSLKSDINAVSSNGSLYFMATADHRYQVIDSKDDRVQIDFNGLKGWIPEWYLLKDSNETKVINVKPYIMIVNSGATIWAFPGASEGSAFGEGKVVRIYKEYGDWVAVNFINYAEGNFGDFWVMKKDLIAWDPKKAKEGRLKAGASKKYADLQENTHVQILNELDETYQVNSYGGVTGEIDKADFVPNPYIDLPIARKSPLVLIDDLELSTKQQKTYNSYTKKSSDDQLKGLSAGEIFKFYLEAISNKDPKTMYALYMQGDLYGTPALEKYLQDMKVNTSSSDQAISSWNELEQNNTFVVQENYMEDNHAIVYIIPLDKNAEMKTFQMYETKAGIWKVAWMPLQ
jgi:hypothetical protein